MAFRLPSRALCSLTFRSLFPLVYVEISTQTCFVARSMIKITDVLVE